MPQRPIGRCGIWYSSPEASHRRPLSKFGSIGPLKLSVTGVLLWTLLTVPA
jgi:hypothetical protein